MRNFIKEQGKKLLLILAIAILAIVCICGIVNVQRKIATNKAKEEIKAQVATPPDGYTAITDVQGLKDMANNLSGKYILMADIDLSGEEWTPIGLNSSTPFKGTFDGNFYTISNLTINSTNQYVGLFGYIENGNIKNLNIKNLNITVLSNNAYYVGGLVGYAVDTSIENIKLIGTNKIISVVPVGGNVGGIVGYLRRYTTTKGAKINVAYACIDIDISTSSNVCVGGIVGQTWGKTNSSRAIISKVYSSGNIILGAGQNGYQSAGITGNVSAATTISNSYSTLNISGSSSRAYMAGIVGYSNKGQTILENVYSIGKLKGVSGNSYISGLVGNDVAAVNNSYWSPKCSGIEESFTEIGTAKTTQELLYQNAYEGWDFTDTWAIEPDGGSLAYLKCFGLQEEITADEVDYETRIGLTRKGTDGASLAGGKYQVKDATGTVVREGKANSKGIFWIRDLGAGTYTVEEVETPVGYVEDKTVYSFKMTEEGIAVDVNTNKEITLEIVTAPLTLLLQSRDKATDLGIQGITIALYNEDGSEAIGIDEKVIKAVTNTEGKVNFSKVPAGTYKYKQTTKKSGYIANETEYTVTISKDGTVTYLEENNGIIYNDIEVSYKIEHYKQTEEGYELVTEDVENLQGIAGKLVTATPKEYTGYIWNKYAKGTVLKGTIEEDGSLALKLYYDKLIENNFNINITNKNAGNSEIIANSKYDVIVEYCDGTTLEFKDQVTDENGNITLSNVVGKNVMRVYFKQTTVPTGFNNDAKEKYVEIKINNTTSEIELTGAKTSGITARTEDNTLYITHFNYALNYENKIRINAIDNIDNEIGLANVSFELVYPDGRVKALVTGEDGIAEISNLPAPGAGSFMYEIRQLNTLSGYKENVDSIYLNIEFNEAGIITNASILNSDLATVSVIKEQEETLENVIANINIEQQRNSENGIFGDYSLHIIEQDKDTNEPIEGVTYKIIEKATTSGLSNIATATKKTNSLGQINTDVVNGDEVVLTIKRTKVPNEYKLVKEEIKVKLIKNVEGGYELQEPVEGVEIDNTSKMITINRKLYKKVSSYNEAKTKVNNEIFITKVDSLLRPLQGVTLELRENETNTKWELTTDDDGLAKISSAELVKTLGSEFPKYLKQGEGKLTFWITEKSVPVGYENIDEDIGFEAYYEITPDGTLEISYMNVLDGLSYYHIIDQEYDQYEQEDYMQVDIKLKVINRYGTDIDETKLNTLKIEKVDSENTNTKLANATFQITLTYPTKGKLRAVETTNKNGIISIPNLYFPEGTTNVQIVEKSAPYGYVLDNTPVNISVTNSSGNITVDGASIDANRIISIQLENTRKEREVPFNVVVNKRDSKTKELIDSTAEFKIEITKGGLTSTYNKATTDGVTGVYGLNGKGNIKVKVQETDAPFGYKTNTNTFTAYLTKENLLSSINLDSSKTSSDNVQIIGNTVYVTVYNEEQDVDITPTLQIRKVDSDNTYIGLQSAKFKITIPDEKGTTRNVTTSKRGYASVILSNGISGRYIIEETIAPYGYYLTKKLALDIVFDSNKNIISCQVVQNLGDDYLNSVYSCTKTSKRIFVTIGNEDIARVTNPIDTYTIRINKVSVNDSTYKLNGAIFDIDINQENGIDYSLTRETRYYRGAYVGGLTGTGKIEVNLRETEAPLGYRYDGTPRSLSFYRDPITKKLTLDASSLKGLYINDIQINNINHLVTITVRNTPLSGTIEQRPDDKGTIGGGNGVFGTETGGSGTTGGSSSGTGTGGTGTGGSGIGGGIKPTPSPSPITPSSGTTNPDFGIQIEKVNKYNNKIKVTGAQYAVYVENEETKQSAVKVLTTDNKGQISFRGIIGYGNFKITIIETDSPESYALDEKVHVIRVHRDAESLMITPIETDTGENVAVRIDNINKVVKATIEESPSTIGFAILKQDYDDEEIALKNSKFEVIDKETNITYELITGEEGMGYLSLPMKENGQHQFTIRETTAPVGYNALAKELTLKVTYLNGVIASAEITGDDDHAYIIKQNTEYIEANVLNSKIEEGIKYDVELIKADAYYSSITFENAKIKMDIDHQVGIQGLTKTSLTNSEGKININNLYGSGKVTIAITEIEPPPGRRFDTKEKQVVLNIDSETGWIKLDKETSNVDVFVDNDTKKVTIRIRNYPDGTFVIGANKVDEEDNDLILYGAKYQLQMEGSSTKYTLRQYSNGLLALTDLPMPSPVATGTYTYTIQEIEAPFGYTLDTTPIVLKVQISKVKGINKITNAYIESGNAEVELYGDEFIHLKLEDTPNDITDPSDTYTISVNKVDSLNKEYKIANTLLGIHVQAESGEDYYKEVKTDENGRINLNNITGTGRITLKIEELLSAPNYLIANGIKTITFTRNPETKEITIDNETSNVIVTENKNVNVTIENTLDPEKAISITVHKVWSDTDAQKSKRPASVKIQLKNGAAVVGEETIGTTRNEDVTFTNIPKYDENGDEIVYTPAEAEVKPGDLKYYVSTYDAETKTITNTFRVPEEMAEEKTSITVHKVWVDTDAQKTKRPASVKIQLKNGAAVVGEETIGTEENKDVTFTNLPKYDENANEIVYTPSEAEVTPGDLKYYVSTYDADTNTITNTFRVPEEMADAKTRIVVYKHWVDTEEQSAHRPAKIRIVLKIGTTVKQDVDIAGNADKEVVFEDIPVYDKNANKITYAVGEQEINEGDLKYYVGSIRIDEETGRVVITNTFTLPEDTVNVTVTKEWNDANNANGKRPNSIVLKLLKGNEEVARDTVTGSRTADTWTHTFTRLPKYAENGNEIDYLVDEEEVNEKDLLYYTKTINQETKTVTNTYIVNASIRKVSKNTGLGLQGAVIVLIDENGVETRGTTNSDGYVTFARLEKGKTYTYKEVQAPLGYELNEEIYTLTVNNDGSIDYGTNNGIIENERKTANVTITKYITGTETQVPGAKIALYDVNGNPVVGTNGKEIVLTTNGEGQITFTKIEPGTYKYKEIEAPLGYVLNENEYTFTIDENGNVTHGENNGIICNEKVRSNVTITKYITGTTTPVEGAVIGLFDKNGNALIGTDGEQIKARTNTSGTITILNLEVGTYKYKELEAPTGYVLNEEMYTLTVNNDGTVDYGTSDGIIYNEKVTKDVTIRKYITGTDTPVEGAKIGLFDKNGNAITGTNGQPIVLTTNTSGEITFTRVEPGTYQYKEIEAPVGYVLNENVYTFTVDENGNVTFGEAGGIIYNRKITANVVIRKYITGTETPVEGAVIGLFDENGNPLTEANGEQIKATTNENGQATFVGLEAGTYKYKEIQAPLGYVLNDKMYTFKVEKSGNVTYTANNGIIYNDIMKYSVVIRKYITGTETKVEGAVIGLFDENGNALIGTNGEQIKATTNENGQVTFTNLTAGTYKYKELQAPLGYVLNDEMYTFQVDKSGNITYTTNNGIIYNETVKTSVTIKKYILNTTTPLAGAEITLYDAKGKEITTKTTGQNGQVTFTNLEVGTYYYKETKAPVGYTLNDETYTFTVNADGTVTHSSNNGIIYNDIIRAEAIIRKYEEGTTIPLAGAEIGLFDKDGNPLIGTNGEQIKAITGQDGTIKILNLPIGTYKYKELQAPLGYILNGTMYTFEVEESGNINYGETGGIIYNTPITINVGIIKLEKDTQKPIAGAIIGLYSEATGGTPIQTVTTKEDGVGTFIGLRPGTYYYKELKAPTGYLLNNTTYSFTINADGTVDYGENKGIIYNDKIRSNVVLIKYEEGTMIPVAGAEIGLFDENGNALIGTNGEQIKATTGQDGKITILNLKEGTYCYKELKAPTGYILNDTMYRFTVGKEGEITYGENKGIIYNAPVKINVGIIKKDKDIKKVLKGAVIGLYKEGQEEAIQTATTKEDGIGRFTGLKAGTYTYKELQAPVGYKLNNTTYTFTINVEGEVTFGENNGIIYNELIPEEPEEPENPEDPEDPKDPVKPDDPTDPTDPTKPDDPVIPDTPNEPTIPDLPIEPVQPEEPKGDYVGILPKTGETVLALMLTGITLSISGIILTYNYIKMKKENR